MSSQVGQSSDTYSTCLEFEALAGTFPNIGICTELGKRTLQEHADLSQVQLKWDIWHGEGELSGRKSAKLASEHHYLGIIASSPEALHAFVQYVCREASPQWYWTGLPQKATLNRPLHTALLTEGVMSSRPGRGNPDFEPVPWKPRATLRTLNRKIWQTCLVTWPQGSEVGRDSVVSHFKDFYMQFIAPDLSLAKVAIQLVGVNWDEFPERQNHPNALAFSVCADKRTSKVDSTMRRFCTYMSHRGWSECTTNKESKRGTAVIMQTSRETVPERLGNAGYNPTPVAQSHHGPVQSSITVDPAADVSRPPLRQSDYRTGASTAQPLAPTHPFPYPSYASTQYPTGWPGHPGLSHHSVYPPTQNHVGHAFVPSFGGDNRRSSNEGPLSQSMQAHDRHVRPTAHNIYAGPAAPGEAIFSGSTAPRVNQSRPSSGGINLANAMNSLHLGYNTGVDPSRRNLTYRPRSRDGPGGRSGT